MTGMDLANLTARLDEAAAAAKAPFPQWPKLPDSLDDWEDLNLRMLRQVEAARKILALHGPDPTGLVCDTCHHEYPCDTARLLAASWSDHPDYQEKWKP